MKGSYILAIYLAYSGQLAIGRLGSFDFPAGHYLYCGSALNGLEARVRRHLRQDKKLHWHVDYLVAAAQIRQVWWQEGCERVECAWAEAIAAHGGVVVASRFGSSDCRCQAHLLWLESERAVDEVRAAALPAGLVVHRHSNDGLRGEAVGGELVESWRNGPSTGSG